MFSNIGAISANRRRGVEYDADALAYFARVEGPTGDNQTLEAAVKTAINDFVVGCKADGIWDAIKASCILAGARTLAGALQPLVGTAPTNFNFVSGDYDRTTGLVGNASTKYLDSNRNNNADPQNSKHMAVYASAMTNSFVSLIGSSTYNVPGFSSLGRVSSSNPVTRIGVNLNGDGPTPTQLGLELAAGFAGVNRASSTTVNYRYNTTSDGLVASSVAKNSTTPDNSNMWLWRINITSTPYYANARFSFYSIGESLDLAALDTRVSNLITALDGAIV